MPWPFTADPLLHGMVLYGQILGIDLPANPLGVTATNPMTYQIVAPFTPPLISRIFLSGSLGPSGTVSGNFVLVTQFD